MGIIERGQKAQAIHNATAIEAHKHQMEQHQNLVSMKNCIECGVAIPEARQQAIPGCCLCVICQELEEGDASGN